MKKQLIIGVLMFITQIIFSQKKENCDAGVYVTFEDFIHNKLSYKINKDKENKLELAFPADVKFTIKIITKDTTYKFKPGSAFGYFDCGDVYRYFEGGKELDAQEDFYKVEEAGDMIIYSSELVSGTETFYSFDLGSPIHRLTFANLMRDFKEYPGFIDLSRQLKFKSSDGLATRDESGKFFINILLDNTLKQY